MLKKIRNIAYVVLLLSCIVLYQDNQSFEFNHAERYEQQVKINKEILESGKGITRKMIENEALYKRQVNDDNDIYIAFFGGIFSIWVIYIFLIFISKKGKEINNGYKNYNSNKRSKEEKIYSQIYTEIKSNTFKKGLMAKALEQSNGDRKKAESLYVKFRFQSIKDENAK